MEAKFSAPVTPVNRTVDSSAPVLAAAVRTAATAAGTLAWDAARLANNQ